MLKKHFGASKMIALTEARLLDDGQITHLIRVRLKILLYDSFGAILAFLCFPPFPFLRCSHLHMFFGQSHIRRRHMTLKLVGPQLGA